MDIIACEKHNIPLSTSPHSGIRYCTICTEESVLAHEGEADDFYNKVQSSLSQPTKEKLEAAIQDSMRMKQQKSKAMAVLRFIASKSARSGKTMNEVVDTLIQEDSLDSLGN